MVPVETGPWLVCVLHRQQHSFTIWVVVGDQNQGDSVLGSIPIASKSSLLGFGLGALFKGLLIKDTLTVKLLELI